MIIDAFIDRFLVWLKASMHAEGSILNTCCKFICVRMPMRNYHLWLIFNCKETILHHVWTEQLLYIWLGEHSNFEDSAAADLRRGDKFHTSFVHSSSLNATVKELLTKVHVCQSYLKHISDTFLWHTLCIVMDL